MKHKCQLIMVIILMIMVAFAVAAEEIKYTEANLEIFNVKLNKPANWEMEVTAENCVFTCPSDKDLQMVFLEAEEYAGTLDQYLKEYETNLVDKKTMKILSSKPFEIAGLAAYYVKLQTEKKDLGHILFLRNKKTYALALKTKKGSFAKYESILMEAARTLKFTTKK